ncbi:hypothetical protein KI387_026403, partial [Taxus chinensis]
IRLNPNGKKCFFINAQQLEVYYQLRGDKVDTLELTQSLAIEIEDDLIIVGKFKKTSFKGKSQETPNDLEDVLTKLDNDVLDLK